MPDPIALKLTALQVAVEAGFESANKRLDDFREEQGHRHKENQDRLVSIEADVKRTNGRVTILEVTNSSNAKWIGIVIALLISAITGTVTFLAFFGKLKP